MISYMNPEQHPGFLTTGLTAGDEELLAAFGLQDLAIMVDPSLEEGLPQDLRSVAGRARLSVALLCNDLNFAPVLGENEAWAHLSDAMKLLGF